jgi:hypothetical protein
MSGPIFVQDAHGTPLMPTAAAHARKLLQQGAQRVPHPTFTIVRLARPVASPSLRPVLLTVEHQGAHLCGIGHRRVAASINA